jgi:acyl-CoA synthetase (AMP-forming)/AMP-acid ligase II
MSPAATVRALVAQQARTQPQALYALATETADRIDYAGLEQQCQRVATLLIAQGTQPGDTVSLVMANGLNTLRLLLGALHGGWCVNPVNLLSSAEQMRYVLEHSDCKLVIASPDWADAVRAVIATLARPVALLVCSADFDAAHDPLPEKATVTPDPTADAMALLMYTSGTTGVPKGVVLTQANLAANAHNISREHGLAPHDRVLAVLPLYHINAFAVTMLAPLAHGGSLAMPPKFSAGSFWQQATGSSCTWINVVPTMISYLLEGTTPPLESLRGIRFCRSASAALPPAHLQAFETRFGIGVIETMGLTETVAPAFSNPLEPAQRKLGSVGRASGCEACVIDAALQPVPDGSTGEIVIRGPQVMRGYYKNEAATQASFTPDGWLRTGDLGHRDADGFFFVTGRIKELIIKGGENIAPREIDEVLLRHPAVLDAAATGIPDTHYGQEIMVCIVLREGQAADEATLRDFCTTHLGRYKTPKVFHFVRDLPRGPSGKVQRLKLLDWVARSA